MKASVTDPVSALARQGFWYLRHGQTDWNARNVSQGNVDIPLNAAGLAQAHAAAPLLTGRGIATIVASPLSRARVTAEIVAETLGLPVQLNPDLREVAFGVQEGQPIADAWFADWLGGSFTPEGAESFAALRARAVRAINACVALPGPVLVVAHGALFRALRAEMGMDLHERLANAVPLFVHPTDAGWQIEATS